MLKMKNEYSEVISPKGIMEDHFMSVALKEEPDNLLQNAYIDEICASPYEKVFLPNENHEVNLDEMVKLDLVEQNMSHQTWVPQIADANPSSCKLTMNSEMIPKVEQAEEEDGGEEEELQEQEDLKLEEPFEEGDEDSEKLQLTISENTEEALNCEDTPNSPHSSKFYKIQCTLCSKWFLNNKSMITHLRLHTTSLTCQICQEQFTDDETLFSHMLEHMQPNGSNETKTLLDCAICDKVFAFRYCLRNHLQAHLNQSLTDSCACCHSVQEDLDNSAAGKVPCKLCERNCRDGPSGNKSNRELGSKRKIANNKSEKGVKPFRCALCPLSFAQRTPLKNHIMTHSEMRPFACKICSKTYKRNSELIRHSMIHTGERPHECKECLMTFREKAKLNAHMVVHTGEKRFQCHICHKFLARKSDLTSHMLSHTGGQYDCQICEKKFTRKSDLTRHVLVHTGEKPFACDLCHMAFREKTRLNNHLLTHTRDKKHACRICEKKFKDRLGLKKHMIDHAGDRPYECYVCQKNFKMKSTLLTHMQVHEEEERVGNHFLEFQEENMEVELQGED